MVNKYSYRVIWSEDDAEFVGLCAEFPSLSWLAKSQDAAFKGIRNLVVDVVADIKKEKGIVPAAISTKHFSGKFQVRVPPELHRELALEAKEANVSLNRYVSAKLARSHHTD